MTPALTRRDAARLALAGMAAPLFGQARTVSVAAIVTEYRFWSHADVIVGRLLGGYSMNGVHRPPSSRVVSLYTDQAPNNDMSRDLAARHGFKIYPTIREALTLGKDSIAVDAAVFVGEHGNYPTNDLGQKQYPRYELFNQILDVYESSRKPVPTFFDKHLSYSWQKAKSIYDRAAKLNVPWFAGSSVPLTVRDPVLEYPLGVRLQEALMIGYGDLDAYGFHTIECLQAMVERRAGGETGVRRVELLSGEAVWRWRDSGAGAWTKPLLDAALARCLKRPQGALEQLVRNPALFLIEYNDGLRAVCYMIQGAVSNWAFAGRRKDSSEIESCRFGLGEAGRPLPHFDGLVYCIEQLFLTGKPMYPVERTLLTTGMLAFLFESKRAGKAVETPELKIAYKAPEPSFFQRS
jgi:hypothetical protein